MQCERFLLPTYRRYLYEGFLVVEPPSEEDKKMNAGNTTEKSGKPKKSGKPDDRLYITIDHDCGRDSSAAAGGGLGAVLGEEEVLPQASFRHCIRPPLAPSSPLPFVSAQQFSLSPKRDPSVTK